MFLQRIRVVKCVCVCDSAFSMYGVEFFVKFFSSHTFFSSLSIQVFFSTTIMNSKAALFLVVANVFMFVCPASSSAFPMKKTGMGRKKCVLMRPPKAMCSRFCGEEKALNAAGVTVVEFVGRDMDWSCVVRVTKLKVRLHFFFIQSSTHFVFFHSPTDIFCS